MKAILLGDRLTCAGYRLAGVDARVVAAADIEAALDTARDNADLVMITAPLSRALGDERRRDAMRDANPPVQVVAGLTDPEDAPDIRRGIMRSLGVGE